MITVRRAPPSPRARSAGTLDVTSATPAMHAKGAPKGARESERSLAEQQEGPPPMSEDSISPHESNSPHPGAGSGSGAAGSSIDVGTDIAEDSPARPGEELAGESTVPEPPFSPDIPPTPRTDGPEPTPDVPGVPDAPDVPGVPDFPPSSEPEPALSEMSEWGTAEPDTAEPDTAEPDTAEPDTAEPDTAEPDLPMSEMAQPGSQEPGAPESGATAFDLTESPDAAPEAPEPTLDLAEGPAERLAPSPMPTPGPVYPPEPMPSPGPVRPPVPMPRPMVTGTGSDEPTREATSEATITDYPVVIGPSEPTTDVAEQAVRAEQAEPAPVSAATASEGPTGTTDPRSVYTAPETTAVESPASARPEPEPAVAEVIPPAADAPPVPPEIAGPEAGGTAAPDAAPPSHAEPAVVGTGERPTERPGSPASPGKPRPAGQRPGGGRPGSRPGRGPSPVPSSPHLGQLVEPIIDPVDPHLWGRIDDSGVVYVSTAAGERPIGNWQAGDVDAGLAHFGRRYDDFATEIGLLEARLASGTGDPKATKHQAIALRESVETLPAIGDLDGAAARLEIVIGAADAAIAGASQARTAARAAAIKTKEALCVEAEELAESTQWKATGDRLKAIVDEWRSVRGIDRKTDDALWKRFAKARDTFTRHRGSHFAELDKQRGAAKEAKEALISKAEELSDATDWGETAGAYRELMTEWKAAGRAPRDVEDALWARFRAAQEKFFSRRNKTFSDRDAEFEANAAVKEKLLAEAEKIDPATGLDKAKAALRSIQERWEAAGKVPRERVREFDARLRAVEDKVKSADERHWRRTDPEAEARVEQFRNRADSYHAQAAKARAAGDERKARQADAQAVQWEEWLKTARGAVDR